MPVGMSHSIHIILDLIQSRLPPRQCYIGYRRLTKAIRLYQKTYPGGSQDRIRISWKPYFLDRDAPMESVPYIGLWPYNPQVRDQS